MGAPGPYRPSGEAPPDLRQGDVIIPGSTVKDAICNVHPWLKDVKYNGFIVVTQSCDLVRRQGNRPKAKHIEIAPFRSLDALVADYVSHITSDQVTDGVYYDSERSQFQAFIQRLINQNETGQGVFYLPPDLAVGIGDHSAAALRVSFALRAANHYEALLADRRGGLSEAFEAKLGWLLGNLYSRPATPDWTPTNGTREGEKTIIEVLVNGGAEGTFAWVPRPHAKQARRENLDLAGLDPRAAAERILACQPPVPLDTALSSIDRVLRRAAPNIGEEAVSQIKKQLANDTAFTGVVKKS